MGATECPTPSTRPAWAPAKRANRDTRAGCVSPMHGRAGSHVRDPALPCASWWQPGTCPACRRHPMTPALDTDQAPVPPPSYHRTVATALHVDALTLVRGLPRLAGCRMARHRARYHG